EAALVGLDLAGQERAACLELAQDIAPERGVLAKPLAPAARRDALPPVPHARPQERQILHRIHERAPLDDLPFFPQEPVELGGVKAPEAAPQHELLRWRDRRDRVELEKTEPAHGLEDAGRRAVETLRPYGDAARRLDVDRHADGGCRP